MSQPKQLLTALLKSNPMKTGQARVADIHTLFDNTHYNLTPLWIHIPDAISLRMEYYHPIDSVQTSKPCLTQTINAQHLLDDLLVVSKKE